MRHSTATRLKYHDIWINFNKFLIKFDRMPATWEDRVYVYIAHLVDNRKQSSTIKTYLSAIRQILLSDGIELKEDKQLLSSMMKTSKMRNDKLFIRLPIKFNLLQLILKKVDSIYGDSGAGQAYLATLLKAMFSTAYFGMFRLGELAKGPHQIKARNFHLANNKNKAIFMLESSKTHNIRQAPKKVVIPGIPQLGKYCPIKLIGEYLKLRENTDSSSAFFMLRGGQPITQYIFRNCLRKVLDNIGVDCSLYDSHSFRQGRCLDLRKLGYTFKAVMEAGRWTSSAILNYLRLY